jgi:hypothetical protein
VDGDHSNNDPGNLVLIEHFDHMRLHNRPGQLERLPDYGAIRKAKSATRAAEIGAAYYAHRSAGLGMVSWVDKTGIDAGRSAAWARAYAKDNNLPWPIA